MTRLLPILALALGTGPLQAGDAHDHDGPAAHLFEIAGLKVLHPWTRATDGDEALIFMDLHNEGETAIAILGGAAGIAAESMLVGFRMQGGTSSYVPLPEVPIQPDRELDLAPDGLAIRLTGLSDALVEGRHLDLTLLTSAGALEIEVAVEAADATRHSHAGHAH